MRRLIFPILILIVSLAAGYQILSMWRGVFLYQTNLSKEGLLKAIRLTPSNPDPYYRLGLFYQWDIRHIDLKESLSHVGRAIERNPLEQEYWLNMAKIFQRRGENRFTERALENAIRVFPAGYQGRWIAGNLYLQQGTFEKALPHFAYILLNYPNQSGLVYEVLLRAFSNTDFTLEQIVPREPSSFKQYLSFLYETNDEESAKKAWRRRASYGFKGNREDVLRHVEFLISRRDFNEAFQVWNDRLHEEGFPIPSGGNLVTNGGFEKEKTLGGGFDWRIVSVAGTEVSFDPEVASEGRQSLKIAFNGKENVDFHHVYQFVALKPDTEYLFNANMKSKGVTTRSGLRIEILGVGIPFHKASESMIGDNGWREMEIAFRTPAKSQGGMVRIRRERTDKFDRFISGTVWIDNVSLIEKK